MLKPARIDFQILQSAFPIFGWLLAASTIIALALVAHHPVADMRSSLQGLENLGLVASASRWVHGSLMVLIIFFSAGFYGFAMRLGLGHPLVATGLVSYLAGSFIMLIAPLFDGFIFSDIGVKFADNPRIAYDFLGYSMIITQACAKLGFVLWALSAFLLGLALLHYKGILRGFGIFAIAFAICASVFIINMQHYFNPHNLLLFMVFLALWHFAVSFILIQSNSTNQLPTESDK